MRFSSARTLALSLLAGQLAVAAPLHLDRDVDHSVQPDNQATVANIGATDLSTRRRPPSALSALAEHLYGRTIPTSTRRKGSDQVAGGGTAPIKRPEDGTDGSSGSGQGKVLKMPDVDSPEWTANKQLATEKGKDLRRQLKQEVSKRGQDTGDTTPVVTEDGPFAERIAKWTDDYDEWDEMEYLFKRIDPNKDFDEDWPTRSTYLKAGGDKYYPALKIAASVENQALSVQNSYKDQAGEDPPRWTRMLFESARALLGQKGLSTLKWINRNNVKSITTQDKQGVFLETADAMDYAYTRLGGTTGKELTIDFNAAEDSPEGEVANYLSAQTHVSRVMQMLKDYPAPFGYKQIAKLHLRNVPGDYSILIELTE